MLNANPKIVQHFAFSIQHSALTYLAFFSALAIAWTWPLVTRLSWRIPHDPGDPLLNTWILWWSTQAVPFTSQWWNAPIFFPMPGALALSEHLTGIAIFTVPLHAAGFTPLASYNVALLLSSGLSGYFAFRLGRRLTGSTIAGIIAGCAFGFAPYRASQLSHLQVLTSQWMPLALMGMHGYLEEGRRRWLIVFSLAWLLLALSNGYYLVFFPVLVALWLAWFVDLRTHRNRGVALLGSFAGTSVLLLPVLLQYKTIHDSLGLRRSLEEILRFSAQPTSFFQPARMLALWPTRDSDIQEGYLFPGLTVITLTLAGFVAVASRRSLLHAIRARSPAVFYGLAALVFWWLSLGPAEGTSSLDALVRPYTFLSWLPGFEGLRAPARFAMLATLCISVGAAFAWARLAPIRRIPRLAALALVFAGLFVDGWIERMPLGAAPQGIRIDAAADAVVIELPTDDPATNVAAMYRSIGHRRPLVNGYSGHTPPHYDLLSRALAQGDAGVLSYFARGRTLVVVVHRKADTDGRWRSLVEQAGGVLQEESGLGPIFVISPKPRQNHPPPGDALPAARLGTEKGYVGLDLGSKRVVRAIRMPLRRRYAEIVRLEVEASGDGATWTTVWTGRTGEAALAAALEDARVVPLTIPLSDITARYLRVTAPAWVGREMTALAPQ